MEYEQDYIMRMIKDVVRALVATALGKPFREYTLPDENAYTTSDDTYCKMLSLADSGHINEAENLLYKNIATTNSQYFEMGLSFYTHLNSFTDTFLEGNDYSRQEIYDGIRNFAEAYGILGLKSN